MIRDMTTGRPLRRILSFCLPLLIGNLFQQLYNMADSFIVGRFINDYAFAAVGSTGAISFLILGFVQGACSGFSIPVAQEFGAGDYERMRKCVANAVYLSIGIGVVMTAATVLYTRQILVLLKTPEEILEYAYDYIFIIFCGIGATLLYNLLAGILRALGDSRTPLYFLALASVLNVALDLLLILAFDAGVAGAGYATVISQLASGILCLIYILRKFPLLRLSRENRRANGAVMRRLLGAGVPMGLQFSITAIGAILVQTSVNLLGPAAVTAVSAASKVYNIFSAPMETMGITMATYCGQNYGAGKIDRIRKGVRQAMLVTLGYSAIAFCASFFFGHALALLFLSTYDGLLISRIHQYLTINGLFYPFLVLIFVLRNSLQGLGFSRAAMFAGLFELAGRSAVAFLLVGTFGFTAVCFANPAAWVAADCLLAPLYFHEIRKLARWQAGRARGLEKSSASGLSQA